MKTIVKILFGIFLIFLIFGKIVTSSETIFLILFALIIVLVLLVKRKKTL